jgi:putative endonuclease
MRPAKKKQEHPLRRAFNAIRERLMRTPAKKPSGALRARTGRAAEEHAVQFLRQRGYRILTRNYSCRQGEVDLIAMNADTIAFVEVRSRTEPAALDPLFTVTRRKQQRVIRAAKHYASSHNLWGGHLALRFDVVAVRLLPDGSVSAIEHIENAFHA